MYVILRMLVAYFEHRSKIRAAGGKYNLVGFNIHPLACQCNIGKILGRLQALKGVYNAALEVVPL